MIARVTRGQRSNSATFLFVGGAWLVYTRLYFVLHPIGLTFAPSLFMEVTGKPDPACGLTRTFAWMWTGDIVHAVRVYPLGPILFVAMIFTMVDAALVVTGHRGIRLPIRLTRGQKRSLIVIVVAAFAANWAAKLIWLGM